MYDTFSVQLVAMRLCKGISFWRDQNQPLYHQRLEGNPGCRVGLPHNGKVQTLIHEANGNISGAELIELHGNSRVAAVKLRQYLGEDPLGTICTHPDAHGALIDAVFRQIEGEILLHV